MTEINDEIEVGICVDEALLPDNKKLPILYIDSNPASWWLVRSNAAAWALSQFNETDVKRLFVNGVCVSIELGLIRHIKNVPTGDWQRTDTSIPITEQIKSELTALVTLEDMRNAMVIIIASKTNFWTMNRHTDQDAVTDYVKEALEEWFPHNKSQYLTEAADLLGRYASTLFMLNEAGIPNIRGDEAIVQSPRTSLRLTSDAKLRFTSLPAGIPRLAVAYEGAKRILRCGYARLCPAVTDFGTLPVLRNAIMANPARYHIKAEYLTGVKRADYTDSDNERFLGRVGIFIKIIQPKCPLASSPYLRDDRIQNYDDYDVDFKWALTRMFPPQVMSPNHAKEDAIQQSANLEIEIEQMRNAFFPRPVVAGPPSLQNSVPD